MKEINLFIPPTSIPFQRPMKDGDIFKVATLNKFVEKYNYFKKCNIDISIFIILKLIDDAWYVYEINKNKNTLSLAKKFRTLTELLQNKMFYGMFYYGNLLDRNVETDRDFSDNNKIIELYKSLFN